MTHAHAAKEKLSAAGAVTQVTRLILPLILLLLLLAGQSRVEAATYYVSQDGTDAAYCGTTKGSNECASIEYALTGRAWPALNFGDTVVLECSKTGSPGACTYDAPNIWKSGSGYYINACNHVGGTSSATNPVTIQAAAGNTVTLNIPSNTVTGFGMFMLLGAWKFQDINFTNTHARAAPFFFFYYSTLPSYLTITATRANTPWTMDAGNVSQHAITTSGALTIGPTVSVSRGIVTNGKNGWGFFTTSVGSGITTYFTQQSMLFYSSGNVFLKENPASIADVTSQNCTMANLSAAYTFGGLTHSDTVSMENNIFGLDTTNTCGLRTVGTPVGFTSQTIQNNVFFKLITVAASTELGTMTNNTVDEWPIDLANGPGTFNLWINPYFNNPVPAGGGTGTDYTIHAIDSAHPCYLCNRGGAAHLPPTDINGNPWSGADVGAYANPRVTGAASCPGGTYGGGQCWPTLDPGSVAFVGDSTGVNANLDAATKGWDLPAGAAATTGGAAISGSRLEDLQWQADRNAQLFGPQTVFILSGHNNYEYNRPTSPGALDTPFIPPGITYASGVPMVEIAMAKYHYWGITPVWLGMTPGKGNPPNIAPLTFVVIAYAMAESKGWKAGNIFREFLMEPNWRINYYDQLNGSGAFNGSDKGWTLGAGWAYGNNDIVKSAGSLGTASASLWHVPSAGDIFLVTYTVSGLTGSGGTITPYVGGAYGTPRSKDGTYTDTITAASASATFAFTVSTSSVTATISNVTVVDTDDVHPSQAGQDATLSYALGLQ
jgi:hypothetical protein